MALGRMYTVTSTAGGSTILTAATAYPLLWGWPASATVTMDISSIRVTLNGPASTTFPANSTVQLQLARVTGTAAGGAAVTPVAHNAAAGTAGEAASSSWYSSTSTAQVTGQTVVTVLWSMAIPYTAGANWAEWVTPGFEWRVPGVVTAGTGVALIATPSQTGVATTATAEIVFTE